VPILHKARQLHEEHSSFVLFAVLFLAFRVLVLLLYRPGGFFADYSDYNTSYLPFAQWSDKDLYPFVDYWLEWPPLFSWWIVGVYRLSLLIPSWTDPRLWYNTLLGLSLLPFEVGNFVLVYLTGLELYDRAKALKCALIYACLFSPLYIWSGWNDCMSLLFLLLGLYLCLRRRAVFAGIMVGLGFWLKVIPLLVFPVGLRVLEGLRRKASFATATCVTLLAIALPFLFASPGFLGAFFANLLGRSSWETVWALLDGYYSYGVVTADRLSIPIDHSTHASSLPWPMITAAFVLLLIWLYSRRLDYRSKLNVVALTALTVNIFTLYSKGYSPQFIVQLIPFVIILLPNLRGVLYIILLECLNFVEATLYFIVLPDQHWVLVATVVFRTLLLVALGVEYGFLLFDVSSSRLRTSQRRASVALLVYVGVALCAMLYPLGQAYAAARYEAEEYRPAIEVIKARSTSGPGVVVVTEQQVYQRLYPFLWGSVTLYLSPDGERLSAIGSSHDELWLLTTQPGSSAAWNWLAENAEQTETYEFPGGKLIRYDLP
jgi:hypothetical protein